MITPPIIKVLIDAGFADGWAFSNNVLILWEHDAEPPAPLTRPEVNNETIIGLSPSE